MSGPPQQRRRDVSRLGVAGSALLVVGLLLCVLYRFTAPDEQHSYTAGGVAPYAVGLTVARTYHIAIHGGVPAETDQGLDPTALSCTIAPAAGVAQPLSITPEKAGTKATNTIATFVARATGRSHITCTGLPAVFVDDADNASPDRSGTYLLLGVIALALGVPLALSALRSSGRREDD